MNSIILYPKLPICCRLVFCMMLCMANFSAFSQVADSTETFSIALEFRPRIEFRNGYRILRSDSTQPAGFTENRTRLYLSYKRKGFVFHTSIQDIRVWGEQNPRATNGTLQLFEGYVEPSITDQFSLRIGRQKVMYDNQRLFAQNNWRQNGGTHDGVRLIWKGTNLNTELFGAYNQQAGSQNNNFETDFSPGFSNYKALVVHYLQFKPNSQLTLTTLNATDAFQDPIRTRKHYWRGTSGGRIEYAKHGYYLTMAAYYQYGDNKTGQRLGAYYWQPEVKVMVAADLTFRLGAEVFSGDNGLKPYQASNSFDALYGVNHRFLGFMDLFTQFPNDLNQAGLIAPYLFAFYNVGQKVTLRADGHLFFSQNNFVPAGETDAIDKYLGFENDLQVQYKPNFFTAIELGFSYGLFTESMEQIKQGGNSDLFQSWGYCMVTFNPELFSWTRKVRAKKN